LIFLLWSGGITFYALVGRFLVRAWWKRNTWYAVTNLRVIALSTRPKRSVQWAWLATLPAVAKEIRRDGIGTIAFTGVRKPSLYDYLRLKGLSSFAIPWARITGPVFVDISEVDRVE
jgi:hypothetical protein